MKINVPQKLTNDPVSALRPYFLEIGLTPSSIYVYYFLLASLLHACLPTLCKQFSPMRTTSPVHLTKLATDHDASHYAIFPSVLLIPPQFQIFFQHPISRYIQII
jgi:hypothetical protein